MCILLLRKSQYICRVVTFTISLRREHGEVADKKTVQTASAFVLFKGCCFAHFGGSHSTRVGIISVASCMHLPVYSAIQNHNELAKTETLIRTCGSLPVIPLITGTGLNRGKSHMLTFNNPCLLKNKQISVDRLIIITQQKNDYKILKI